MNFEVTPLLAVSKGQGMIYAVIQTPPGCTLEYTSDKSYEVQAFAKGIEGITSVSSLVGYEVLTESWGSNMGTCLIKLKPWSQLKLSSRQIIEMLEEKCRQIPHAKLQFFEPPAVPGFGVAGAIVPDQPPAGRRAEPLEPAMKARRTSRAVPVKGDNLIVDWIPADGQGRESHRRRSEWRALIP
jgi:hypothetical protein